MSFVAPSPPPSSCPVPSDWLACTFTLSDRSHADADSLSFLVVLCRNPHASHIISCDVLSRSITPDGTLHTRRLILKSGKVPVWARALVGGWGEGLGAWVVEDSWVSESAPSSPWAQYSAV